MLSSCFSPVLCSLALLLSLLSGAYSNDPFEGNFPTLKCVKRRHITGCNESLVDAYERTNTSKSDRNGNRADTFVYLFTCRNRKCAEFLHECGGRLPDNTNFRSDKKTVIIVGGYFSDVCNMAFFQELKDQLLYRDCYNVLLIDWPWGNAPDVYSAYRNSEVVGKQIAFVVKNIVEQKGISPRQVHIIGHSIGAHIAGYAGRYFREFTGFQLRRVTGLDPGNAGNITNAGIENRLDPSDAERVDCIHSSASDCFPIGFGIKAPCGHADFYVNGGYWQYSCIPLILHRFLKGDVFVAIVSFFLPICFHFQSVEYFKVSINPCDCQFIGVKCTSYEEFKSGKCRRCGLNGTNCAVMGMDWEYYPHEIGNESMIYYLDTSISCPYCDNRLIATEGFPSSPVPEGKTKRCFSAQKNHSVEICSSPL